MTATLDGVTAKRTRPELTAEEAAARELVRLAREQGLSLTGPEGLLKQLTKTSRGMGRVPSPRIGATIRLKVVRQREVTGPASA
jgi:hypothetical protein